jgi:hypothetical protein
MSLVRASSPLKYVSPPSPSPCPSDAATATGAAAVDAEAEAEAAEPPAPAAACIVTLAAGAGSLSWAGFMRAGSSVGWCTSRSRPFSDRKRSAASAAMQPEPAAVTAWRQCGSCTSPAAKTPGREVSGEPGFTLMYPTASVST